jgi:hypothetical protein
MIWLFRRGLFRPLGPAWLAFAAYRYWRRLPATRKEEIRSRARAFAVRIQRALASSSLSSRLPRRRYGQTVVGQSA